jgi:hypothetical protein
VQARRRGRESDRSAARALQTRQQPLGHDPGHAHVPGLRPPLPRQGSAVQAGPALAALCRRGRVLPLARIRVPGQALPRMAGLPARLAVLAALPLRPLPLPGLPLLPGRDALLRARRPGLRAVHPQPALHLRQSQLKPPLPLPRAASSSAASPAISASRASSSPRSRAFAARSPATSSGTRSSGIPAGCHASPCPPDSHPSNPGRHQPRCRHRVNLNTVSWGTGELEQHPGRAWAPAAAVNRRDRCAGSVLETTVASGQAQQRADQN